MFLGHFFLFLYGGAFGVVLVGFIILVLGFFLFTVRGDGSPEEVSAEKKARALERKAIFEEVRASIHLPETPQAFVKPVNEYEFARWGETQRPQCYDQEVERQFQEPVNSPGAVNPQPTASDSTSTIGGRPTGAYLHRRQSIFSGSGMNSAIGTQIRKQHGALLEGKTKFNYKINVTVIRAENLVGANKNGAIRNKLTASNSCLVAGKSNPYIKLRLGTQEVKTKHVLRSLNPEYHATFVLNVRDPETDTLVIKVFDYEKVGAATPLVS